MVTSRPFRQRATPRRKLHGRSRVFVFLVVIILIAVGVSAVAIATTIWRWNHGHLNVRGEVQDFQTGEPIAHARVIVSAHYARFLAVKARYYGIVADREGRFVVDTDVPFEIHKAVVEASTPNDRYAKVEVIGNPVILKPRPLPKGEKSRHGMHFDRFTGAQIINTTQDEMEFLGEGWETRTSREIESGYPPVNVRPDPE